MTSPTLSGDTVYVFHDFSVVLVSLKVGSISPDHLILSFSLRRIWKLQEPTVLWNFFVHMFRKGSCQFTTLYPKLEDPGDQKSTGHTLISV